MTPELNWITPKSSQINRFAYTADTQTLTVEFKSGGTYEYTHVTPGEFDGMQHAESAGKFLQSQIKGVKPFKKVTPAPADPNEAAFTAMKIKIVFCTLHTLHGVGLGTAKEEMSGTTLKFDTHGYSELCGIVKRECKIEFNSAAHEPAFMNASIGEWARCIALDVIRSQNHA